MIATIEFQHRGEGRRAMRCGPINILSGPSGTGKTKTLRALRQAFTKDGTCETVKITTDEGRTIDAHGDGFFQLFDKRRGGVVPDAFAAVRRSNPDCVFDPHLLLEKGAQAPLKADVERLLLSGLPDDCLLAAGVPAGELAEFRRDPPAYLSARARPQNEAEANMLRARLADMENFRRLTDALAEVEEMMKPFEDAPKVSQEEVNAQNERIYAAEDRFRNAGSDPDRRRTLYAELMENKDLGDKLKRGAQMAFEKMRLELRRNSILNVISQCRQDFGPDINRAIESAAAEIAALERSAAQVDAQALYAAINSKGWYLTPVPGCAVAVGDGVGTARERAGEISYKDRPLRDHGKLTRTLVLCALVKWLHPRASVLVLDDMESLGVPDGVADFIRKLEKSKNPVQFFGALTLDDRDDELAGFKGFLKKYEPEVSHV